MATLAVTEVAMPQILSKMEIRSSASSSTIHSIDSPKGPMPMAICGMATRLPGGISSAEQLWDLLVNKGDARSRIPASRYATHGPQGNGTSSTAPADSGEDGGVKTASAASTDSPHWKTHSYMLNDVDLAAFDALPFSMTRAELGIVDPQQRLLLELTR